MKGRSREAPSRTFLDPATEFQERRAAAESRLYNAKCANLPDFQERRVDAILQIYNNGQALAVPCSVSNRGVVSAADLSNFARQNRKKSKFKAEWDKEHKDVVKEFHNDILA